LADIVAQAVVQVLRPVLATEHVDFRRGIHRATDRMMALATAQLFAEVEGRTVWVLTSLQKAHEKLDLKLALETLGATHLPENLLKLIAELIRLKHSPGICSNSVVATVVLNYCLFQTLDQEWLLQERVMPLVGFGEHLLIPCGSVSEAESAVNRLGKTVHGLGLRLSSPEDISVINLSKCELADFFGWKIRANDAGKLEFATSKAMWSNLRYRLNRVPRGKLLFQRCLEAVRQWIIECRPARELADPDAFHSRLMKFVPKVVNTRLKLQPDAVRMACDEGTQKWNESVAWQRQRLRERQLFLKQLEFAEMSE
jgi:hypothetical protein